MNCDRMTDFPSCLIARRLLCHLILNCDHNKTLSSYEAHMCVEHTKSEKIKRSNTTEALFSQVNRGAEHSFVFTKANHVVQSSVQISINDSRRCNYARKSYESNISGIAAKIGDRSCSPAIISVDAEKTHPVKKKQATGNETETHLEFLFAELLNC